MAEITLRGNPMHTVGELPSIGSTAPAYTLTGTDLADVSNAGQDGRRIVLNIFPSIDTPTCAASVRRFNELAASLDNTTVLNVSKDLPFAQSRFCGSEGIENAETASAFRSEFGDDYGVTLADGPLAGLFARAVVVIDENGNITHTQLVSEIADEPDYDSALNALA